MNQRTDVSRRACFIVMVGVHGAVYAADIDKGLHFRAQSRSAVQTLTISPIESPLTETISVRFAHRASNPTCSFEVSTEATRLPQTGKPDDYNEALPDGSYVRVANYKAHGGSVTELSVDVTSRRARFAAISVAPPTSYDAKVCGQRGPIEVVFFR